MTEHDRVQDARIAANEDAIRRQTEYLREIRDHFLPEAEHARFERLKKYVVGPVLKGIALIAFIGGLWDVIAWCIARAEIKDMADRYARVAQEIYYTENNPEVAGGFLDKAIELRDGDAEYRFLRAYIEGMGVTRKLLNLDRPFTKAELDQAHKAYAEALFLQGLKASRPEPYILQGQILMALKEPDRAAAVIEKAVALAPDNDFVYIRRACLRLEKKDLAGAEADLDKALQLNPKSKWALLWKGVVARDHKGDCETARAFYDRALELDPRFDLAWYNRGWSWVPQKGARDYAKARADMEKALVINPDYKEAFYAIGMFYGYEDNYPLAKTYLDKAIGVDASFLTALKWRGIVNVEMGKFAEAAEDYGRAIVLDPRNADLYVRRARARENLPGQLESALDDLRFAYMLQPKAKRTLMYMGDIYRKTGDADAALAWYGRAIEVDASYCDAHGKIAAVLAEKGREKESMDAVETAIRTAGAKPERFVLQKAGLLERFGHVADARSCYAAALQSNPRLAAAWLKEADFAKAAGEREAEIAALKKYLELKPADVGVRRRLEAMR